MYYFHSGDLIRHVSIIRETVRKSVSDEPEWEYTTDTAVIFELSNGALAVSKMALDGEMLRVAFAGSMDRLEIPDADAFWYHWSVLGTEFSRSRKWLSVGDLVEQGGA